MAEYRKSPEVKEIAKELISKYHKHLQSARMEYLFRDKAGKSGGNAVLGNTRKVSGIYQTLTGLDFIIDIAEDTWQELTENQRYALIDHELYHCGINEQGNFVIIKHDVTEFIPIIKRYGLWTEGLQVLGQNVDMNVPKETKGDNVVPLNKASNE
ncbi:MAG: putative metallopeptidase [bacterium]